MYAAAEGFAGKRSAEKIGSQGLRKVHEEFGRQADALSLKDDGGIPHVYEYGMEGMESGRLWRAPITGVGERQSVNFFFEKSVKTVPIPQNELADAAARGFTRAEHVWADKAIDQEYTRVFEIRAGGPAPTRVTEGQSQWLLIYDGRGEPMYRKTWRNYSPYVGNFRAFFETFWNTEPERILESQGEEFLEKDFKKEIEREVQAKVREARRTGSRYAPTPSIVSVTVKGVPRKLNTNPDRSMVSKMNRSMRRMYR